jgi:sugar lactone lactonase YvrE
VLVDPLGAIYVTDMTMSRVVRVPFVSSEPSSVICDDFTAGYPVSLAFDSKGNLYVLDTNEQVLMFPRESSCYCTVSTGEFVRVS